MITGGGLAYIGAFPGIFGQIVQLNAIILKPFNKLITSGFNSTGRAITRAMIVGGNANRVDGLQVWYRANPNRQLFQEQVVQPRSIV